MRVHWCDIWKWRERMEGARVSQRQNTEGKGGSSRQLSRSTTVPNVISQRGMNKTLSISYLCSVRMSTMSQDGKGVDQKCEVYAFRPGHFSWTPERDSEKGRIGRSS